MDKLDQVLFAVNEIVRMQDLGKIHKGLGGPFLGEMDWLAELHSLVKGDYDAEFKINVG